MGIPDSWGFPLVSAAIQVYPVHRICLAYKVHLSPCLQHSNSWLLPSILGLIDWDLVNFFYFESHVDQNLDRLGIRVEWQKLPNTSRTVRRQRKLCHDGGFRKREHQTLFLLHGHRSSWSEKWLGTFEDSSYNKAKPGQR